MTYRDCYLYEPEKERGMSEHEWYCPNCGPQKFVKNVGGLGEIYGFNCLACTRAVTKEIPAFVTALLARAEAAEKGQDAIAAELAEAEGGRLYWREMHSQLESELSALREAVRWIPVSERLPDGIGPYETVVYDREADARYCEEAYYQHDCWEVPNFLTVEYWREIQPLPAPPQEQPHDKD